MTTTDPITNRPATWDPDRTYLFLHVMKTGGTSMLRYILDNFPMGQVEPDIRIRLAAGMKDAPAGPSTYGSVARVRTLPDERRREVRVFAGHYPYMITELFPTDVTMTVLRDPVDRTISFLRHSQRYDPALADASLESIYDGTFEFALLIRNYQSKLFAMRLTDDAPDKAHLADLVVDEERLEVAKANLAAVDVIGLQHRFDEFLDVLAHRYGWTFPDRHRKRVAGEDESVATALVERIVADNQADIEFFRHAEALVDERAGHRADNRA